MDTDLSIPEALLLLALDDESGKPVLDATTLAQTLGAAGLSELVLQGRLRIAGESEGGGTGAGGTKPGRFVVGPGVADRRFEPFVEHADGKTPKDAIAKIVGWGGTKAPAQVLRATLLGELASGGALEREETRFLGLTWAERWKRGGRTDVEDALQARARALLASATPPEPADERIAAAIGILHGAKALPKIFPDLDASALAARADALATGSWANEAVQKAIKEVQDAMTVVMITTIAVPMMTSN